MTEITDLSTTDSSNTTVTGESIDGAIANMGRMDNTLQAILGLLARSIRTNVLRFLDNADPTKKVALDLTGLPTATERTWTAPYYSGTLGLVSDIRGQIFGLTLSNNVTDPTNDIDIAAGSAVDTTGSVSMLLASAYTKRLDAAWAVGSGNGGRMSAAAITDTTYHIFLIRRPDNGVVDVGFDISPTAPTLPTNYTQFRRIGSIMRESGAIVGFYQNGDRFIRKVLASYDSGLNPGTSSFTVTLGVPLGLVLETILQVGSIANGSNADGRGAIYNSIAPPAAGQYNFGASNVTATGNPQFWNEITVTCVATAQTTARLAASGAASRLLINTVGWYDTRGKEG